MFGGGADSLEAGEDGKVLPFAEGVAEFFGLVKAPFAPPDGVEGDEDEAVPWVACGELAEALFEPIGEGAKVVELVTVFEGVDGFTDGSFGAVRGAGPVEAPDAVLAIGAEEEAGEGTVKGFAALGAEGGIDPAGGVRLIEGRGRKGQVKAEFSPIG